MSSDIVSAQVSTKPITFTKVQSGWFFKEDRQELVGTYNANFYRFAEVKATTTIVDEFRHPIPQYQRHGLGNEEEARTLVYRRRTKEQGPSRKFCQR